MTLFFVALYGLLFGSFFNVVIYRLPNNMSLANPPSHCTSCKNRLKVIDLIPVFSWLFLRGKCRYCGEKISIRYTLVEVLTSVLWVIVYLRFENSIIDAIAAIILISIMLCALFIDLEHNIIPDELVLFGMGCGGVIMILNGLSPWKMQIYGDSNWWNPLIGAVTGSGILFIIALVGEKIYKTDDAMGMGDVKIFIPIGLLMGWRMALVVLAIAIVFGAISGVMIVILKKMRIKSGLPFGPAIAIGVFTTYVFGWDLLNWYMKFF